MSDLVERLRAEADYFDGLALQWSLERGSEERRKILHDRSAMLRQAAKALSTPPGSVNEELLDVAKGGRSLCLALIVDAEQRGKPLIAGHVIRKDLERFEAAISRAEDLPTEGDSSSVAESGGTAIEPKTDSAEGH